jgi:N-methylhydantoinase A
MSRVAIDVGGTFTDCLVLGDQGQLRDFKAPTTPDEPSRGLMDCLEKAARAEGKSVQEFVGGLDSVIHGTTLATNALLTEKGAKVAMFTTAGFRDELEIRRGFKNIRTSMYNLSVPPYKPLVPRYLRLPIRERTLYTGEIETPVDLTTVKEAMEKCRAEDVRSIAVCFLHSYANPENERQVAEICRDSFDGRVYVTASHEVLPNWGEYERFSTTVVSAYIGPIVSDYLLALEKQLAEKGLKGGLLIVRSDALVQSATHSRRQAVTLINSGPAAAPTGALFWGRSSNQSNLISIDMGGTSLDVCLIRKGEIPTTTESWVGDERVATKMVDIHSIGAGGGSLAWIDSLGLLRVGPQSAGAMPGPACYGRGGDKPTVTDADVVLGYIPTDYFLGGEIMLEEARAKSAVRSIAEPLKMSETQAAQTIFQTVNALMADQVIELSTKRGLDVRDFSLAVGGGAGPVHGACVAEMLGIPTVIVPKYAALYSAFGMFAMEVGREYSRSFIVRADKLDLERIESLYEELAEQASADFKETHTEASELIFNRSADMRYAGQFHELEIPLPSRFNSPADVEAVAGAFHARHKELYTFDLPQRGLDFLTFRLKATAARKSDLRIVPVAPGGPDPKPALKRVRRCFFGNDWVETPCYQGERLLAGNVISGPALIEEKATTVVIPKGFSCTVDAGGTYVLTRS